MFDIGFGELLVCAIVALLVLGPERLPGAVRTAGRWIGRARHTVNNFTDQIDRELRAEELRRRIEEEVKKAGVRELGREVDDVSRQVSDALRAPLSIPLVGGEHLRDSSAAPDPSPVAGTPEHSILPPAPAPATTAPDAGPAAMNEASQPPAAPPQAPAPHAAPLPSDRPQ